MGCHEERAGKFKKNQKEFIHMKNKVIANKIFLD